MNEQGLANLGLTKVARAVIVEWKDQESYHQVECAAREDLTSPADEFLNMLREGTWEDDPDLAQIPDDEQVNDYYQLIHKMTFVADYGEPERGSDVNYLDSGIWEFKVGVKRLAFYDTDGQGNWVPKKKILDIKEAVPGAKIWWFPEMDGYLRLLNYWGKVSPKADPADIDEAITIAGEDVKHDEQS